MYAYHMLGVEASLLGSNNRAGVVTVRTVAVVAEPTHQLGPRLRGALRVPARLGGRTGETEPRKGRDDHVERVGRVPAVSVRVGERTDEAKVLNHRVRPAVGEDQRRGVGLGGADVQEVDVLAVDGSGELRVGVQLRFPFAPVVAGLPVLNQVLDVVERYAVLPTRRDRTRLDRVPARLGRKLVGPAGTRQPVGQVVEIGLGDVDPERPDLRIQVVTSHGRNLLSVWLTAANRMSWVKVPCDGAGSVCSRSGPLARTSDQDVPPYGWPSPKCNFIRGLDR